MNYAMESKAETSVQGKDATEVTCLKTEVLHQKVKTTARSQVSTIMTHESVEKRLWLITLQEELNWTEIRSDLYRRFSQLAQT